MNSPAQTLSCTQCGGELHPDEGQAFLSCPYCGATVYVDKSRVVFHWYVAPTLDQPQAQAALYRWMSGSQTVKDLDKKARLGGFTFQYFPLWYFKRPAPVARKEDILLQPAAATSVTELTQLSLPAGDLRRYESSLDAQSQPPTVPLDAALGWTGQGTAFSEAALVHVPLYFFKYEYNGEPYAAVVDAAGGNVLASRYPAKSETPYLLVGGVTALVYLFLAVLALLVGSISTGLVFYAGLGALAAPFLFAWAFWVASRV